MKYKVLRDSREQAGWTFPVSQSCDGTEIVTLPTGDYSLVGFENSFVIERKGTTAEFAKNILEKRFDAELERLDSFAYPFIVLEFTMEDLLSFPKNSGIPLNCWHKIKTNPWFLLKRFLDYQFKYRSKIILAGTHGKEVASSLFKRMIEHGEEKKLIKRTRRQRS